MTPVTALVSIVFGIVVTGLVMPYGFPLVTPLVAFLAMLTLIFVLVDGGKLYWDPELTLLYLGVTGLLFLGIGQSDMLFVNVRADALNAMVGWVMVLVLARIAATGQLRKCIALSARLVFVLMIPVAALCLYKFWLLIHGRRLDEVISIGADGRYPMGSALQTDYNMAALGLSVAALAGSWLLVRTDRVWQRWAIASGIILILAAAILTGSRRFYLLFGLAMIVVLVVALPWAGRIGGRFMIRWRVSTGSILPIVAVGGAVTTIWLSAGHEIAAAVSVASFDQVERLFARLATLATLGDTLESGRGQLLASSVSIAEGFSLRQLTFGDGFGYLRILADGQGETYPHNPFIAGLLHGGVLNLLMVTVFVLRAGGHYLAHWRMAPFLALTFFLTMSFTMISGNTIFSNRLLVLLLIFAFYLRYMHQDAEELS